MKFKTARTTHKATLGTAIVPGGMPTPGACLRGMSGINPSHRQSTFLCLVHEESKELGEGPAMHTALCGGVVLGSHALANVGQIFECQRPARWSSFGKLLRQDMIAVTPKTSLFSPQMTQMS